MCSKLYECLLLSLAWARLKPFVWFAVVLIALWTHSTERAFSFHQEIRFKEDFEEVIWPDSTLWMGDMTHFRIDTLSNNDHVLRLNAPEAGYSTLYTYQEGTSGTWSLEIHHEYIPTTANRSWYFLMADHPPNAENVSGYALQFGESGMDKSIHLLRFEKGRSSTVLSLPWSEPDKVLEVQANRDERGFWDLRLRQYSMDPWQQSERVQDSLLQSSLYSGLFSVYTNTRKDRMWIDAISFTTRPGVFKLISHEIINQNTITLRFNQRIRETSGFTIPIHRSDGWMTQASTAFLGELIVLKTDESLQDGVYSIPLESIRNSVDLAPEQELLETAIQNPFALASFSFISDSKIALEFTLPPSNPESLDDRVLLSGLGPASMQWLDSVSVEFSFPSSFNFGIHPLEFQNLMSSNGWIFPFERLDVIRHHDPAPGNLVISELLFDPSHLGEAFIELTNMTDKYLSLNDWLLIRKGRGLDRDRLLSELPLSILPRQRIAVAKDPWILQQQFTETTWISMRDFPGLNRSAEDALLLITPMGEVSDSITYQPSRWLADGRSLERRSLEKPGWIRDNWALTIASESATPGFPADVLPDTSGPLLMGANFLSPDSILVSFNEVLESSLPESNRTLPDPIVTGSRAIASLESLKSNLLLVLAAQMEPDSLFSADLQGVADIFGNSLYNNTLNVRFHEPLDSLEIGDVVINEFQRVAFGALGEFVELHNTRDKAVKLDGWKMRIQSQNHAFVKGTYIRPESHLVIPTRDWTPTFLDAEQWTQIHTFTSLPNQRGVLILQSSDGVSIDSLEYGADWSISSDSLSLQRKDPAAPSSDPTQWVEASPTPGSVNESIHLDSEPPRAWMAELTPGKDSIRVSFDEFPLWSTTTSLEIENHPLVIPFDAPEIDRNKIFIPLPDETSFSEAGWVVLNGITDQKNNLADPIRVPVMRRPAKGELIISEVLFHPIQKSDDGLPDQTQFIELFNRSDSWLMLDQLSFHLGRDELGLKRRIFPKCTYCPPQLPFPLVPPKSFVLLYPDDIHRSFGESPTARAFPSSIRPLWDGPFSHPDLLTLSTLWNGDWPMGWTVNGFESPLTALRVPAKTLSLNSESNRITVEYGDQILDSAWVDVSHHHWHVEMTQGRSLERIRYDVDGFLKSNWGTSADPSGGTPGWDNTLRLDEVPEMDSELVLSPNPFSPDEDAFEDILQIHYRLPAVDFQLRARVYDRSGRLISRIADGRSAGSEGTLLWNGRDNGGNRLPIGLYILLFEAFNSRDHPPVRHKTPVIIAGG